MMPFDEVFDLLGSCFRTTGEKYSGDGEDCEDGDGKVVEGFTHLESSECVLEPGDLQEEESCKVALT